MHLIDQKETYRHFIMLQKLNAVLILKKVSHFSENIMK